MGASFIRNILRIIDILPFIYIIGMILIARSDKKQRLGDRAAHTIVIKEGTQREFTPTQAPTPTEETKYCLSCGKKIPSEAELQGMSLERMLQEVTPIILSAMEDFVEN